MVIPQAFYSTRGTPLSAYHRIRELVERGHTVDVLTYPIGAEPPDLEVNVYRSRGPHFAKTIKAGPTKRKIWFDFLLSLSLVARLFRGKYDLVYTHEEAAFMLSFLGPMFRVPYIYDMHSSLPLQITDWKFSKRRSVIRLFEWIERRSVARAKAVVAISPAVEKAAHTADPDTPTVVLVNHFSIETANKTLDGQAMRERHNISSSIPLFVYTGSFVELQALDLLLEAFVKVRAKIPDSHLLMVGGQPAELEFYKQMAVELGITEGLTIFESRPQYEMPAYLDAADVLVSPRTQGINPPGKLFSYLDSGRVMVATDCLVHNQLVSRDFAYLSDANAMSFADNMIESVTDPNKSMEKAAAAQAFIEEYCSPAARERAFEDLLRLVAR